MIAVLCISGGGSDEVSETRLRLPVDQARCGGSLQVNPDDRPLLGLCWDGQVFLDTTLPFGLRSVPKIFNEVADGLF